MQRSSTHARIFVIALGLVLGAFATHAQVSSMWSNAAGGNYQTPSDWDNGVPLRGTNPVWGLAGTTYTVTWSANSSSSWAMVTGTASTVTFDLGGRTHRIFTTTGAYGEPIFFLGTNAADNVTLVVSNGTIQAPTGANVDFRVGSGGTLILTNGGKVLSGWVTWQSNVLVSGAGSYLNSADAGGGGTAGSLTINDGASALLRNIGDTSSVLVDNATLTNRGSSFLNSAGHTFRVINGSTWYGEENPVLLGQTGGDTSRLIVGNTGAVSRVSQLVMRTEETLASARGNTETIVSTNGVVQIRGGTFAQQSPMYSVATSNLYGRVDWKLQDNSILTLRGGSIAMNTNTAIGITDNNTTTVGASFTDTGTGILRGYGVVSNYNAGGNFKILNHGVIRPGDLGVESGTVSSNIAGYGTISIVRGDLVMTNPLSQVKSGIYFGFSDTQLDQIAISGGSAWITGGSNVWTLGTSASTPAPGVKFGLGIYDFITATNLVWSPEYANLTNLLGGYSLVQGVDYSFGVVDLGGGLQALRLQFVPEPSTALLLVGGGLLLVRLRKGFRTRSLLGLGLALALGTGSASAQYSVFTNTAGGSFGTAANWDNGVPNIGTAFSNATFNLGATTYAVTLDATRTNSAVLITNTGQNVTFDLGGFTYRANTINGIKIGSNNTDVITVTVTNGTLQVNEGTNWQLLLGNASSLIVTNGGKVRSSILAGNGNVLVSGPGTYMHGQEGGSFGSSVAGGTNIINNGATVFWRNGNNSADLLLIDGATLTNAAHSFLSFPGDTWRVINGGLVYAQAAAGAMTLGLNAVGNNARLIVGNTGAVSMVSQLAISHEESTPQNRNNVDVIVSTNGIVQIRGGDIRNMYAAATSNLYGRAEWRLQDNGIITLRGGAIAMNTNTAIGLTDNNATTAFADAGTALLRGYGTISNYNAGGNFKVLNHGVIRPGDYGYEVGTHSNLVAIGAINMVRGDLVMTNPLSQVGSAIYFDFSDTALDQINISGGSAWVTGGSNIWTLGTGSATPTPGVKFGLGVYDFITATNLVWSPEYANLTNLLNSYSLVQGVDYQFGVVDAGGGLQALRLQFVPEPSTALLLLGGGWLAWRARRKK